MNTGRQSIFNIDSNSGKATNIAHTYVKRTGFGMLVAVTLLIACALPVHAALPAPPSPVTEKSIQNTVWKLQSWTLPDNSRRDIPSEQNQATLEFAPDNKLIGYTGCNTIPGEYSFEQDQVWIKTDRRTRRNCSRLQDYKFERQYERALSNSIETDILGGSPPTLMIRTYDGERLEFRFLRQNFAAQMNSAPRVTEEQIKNTKWTLTRWESADGDMRELPTNGQPFRLGFSDQGKAEGDTGCTSIDATYTFANGNLSMQPAATAGRGGEKISHDRQGNDMQECPSRLMEQDYVYSLTQIRAAYIQAASSTSQRLRLFLDNYDMLEFERSPGG